MDANTILIGIGLTLLAALVVILIAGARARAHLQATYPARGQLVDVGGYRLHLHCQGEGAPTVVMDAGQGAPGVAWDLVGPGVAAFTRVCVFDRAGLGWSEPSPKPRLPSVMAEELHALLHRAGIAGPYVLVGHSYGGLNARVFAHRYPDEVAGLVLVDSTHEDQFQNETLRRAAERMSGMLPVIAGALGVLIRTGIPALKPDLLPDVSGLDASKVPPDMLAVYRALGNKSPRAILTSASELKAVMEAHAEVRALRINSLGDIPLIVIRHGQTQAQMTPELTELVEETNVRLQAELARQSSRGKLIVAENSGHNVPVDQPELIVQAIQEVVLAGRAQPEQPAPIHTQASRPAGAPASPTV